jgi:hypothetical protein
MNLSRSRNNSKSNSGNNTNSTILDEDFNAYINATPAQRREIDIRTNRKIAKYLAEREVFIRESERKAKELANSRNNQYLQLEAAGLLDYTMGQASTLQNTNSRNAKPRGFRTNSNTKVNTNTKTNIKANTKANIKANTKANTNANIKANNNRSKKNTDVNTKSNTNTKSNNKPNVKSK